MVRPVQVDGVVICITDAETVSGTWVRVGYDSRTGVIGYDYPFAGAATDIVADALDTSEDVVLLRPVNHGLALYAVADRYYVGPAPTGGAPPTMHAALVTAEDALAIKASLRAPEQARVQTALETVRAALSAARPAPTEAPEDA
jgi:hypothetical protein